MRISEMQKRLKSIKAWQLMIPILEETAPQIIQKNQDQLSDGKKSDESVTKKYSAPYLKYKQTLSTYKAPDGLADLRKTGDAYKGMYAKPNNKGVKVGTNNKEKILEGRDGKKIWGLNAESKKELKPIWVDKLVGSIRKQISN